MKKSILSIVYIVFLTNILVYADRDVKEITQFVESSPVRKTANTLQYKYTGKLEGNSMEGKGTLTRTTKKSITTYTGVWKEDLPNGNFTVERKIKDKILSSYEGGLEWVEENKKYFLKFHGEGIKIDYDQTIKGNKYKKITYKGNWENGVRTDKFEVFYSQK